MCYFQAYLVISNKHFKPTRKQLYFEEIAQDRLQPSSVCLPSYFTCLIIPERLHGGLQRQTKYNEMPRGCMIRDSVPVWRAADTASVPGFLALPLSLTGCFRQVLQTPCPQSFWCIQWGSRQCPGHLRVILGSKGSAPVSYM